eukprot:gene32824-biopygen21207
MDIGAQNDSMSGAVRLKERIVVFLGLAIFGAVFLAFRSSDCILHVYIAAHNFKNIVMMAALYSATIWILAVDANPWQTLNATTLIFYVGIGSFFAAVIIVVPGRTARMIAALNMSMLSLKQIFVRYVSHEIRSPLNIVHAGLDIMLSEIDTNSGAPVVFISPETAKMVRNMFVASETAIQILNDLLQYEHIDAGALPAMS